MTDNATRCSRCGEPMRRQPVDVEFARRLTGYPVVRYRCIPGEVCSNCGLEIVDGPLMMELERLADGYLETGDESPLRKLAPRQIEVRLVAA